jgi:hypothetical protein
MEGRELLQVAQVRRWLASEVWGFLCSICVLFVSIFWLLASVIRLLLPVEVDVFVESRWGAVCGAML